MVEYFVVSDTPPAQTMRSSPIRRRLAAGGHGDVVHDLGADAAARRRRVRPPR